MSSFFYVLFSWKASERDNILCLGAFLPVRDIELDLLAVCKGLETITLDGAEMDKNIGAVFTLDKAESLGFIKPFNSASCCRHISYLYCLRRHVAASCHLVIIYNRTDELDGTSTANINTAETTQLLEV